MNKRYLKTRTFERDNKRFHEYCDTYGKNDIWRHTIIEDAEIKKGGTIEAIVGRFGNYAVSKCNCFDDESQRPKEYTFETFDPKAKNFKDTKIIKEILTSAKNFILDQNLIFMLAGPSEVGKSHICRAIINRALEHRKSTDIVMIGELTTIWNDIRKAGYDGKAIARNDLEHLSKVDILLIDELNEFSFKEHLIDLQELLEKRKKSGKKTIVTTNLNDPKKMRETYNDRIWNRLSSDSVNYFIDANRYYSRG